MGGKYQIINQKVEARGNSRNRRIDFSKRQFAWPQKEEMIRQRKEKARKKGASG